MKISLRREILILTCFFHLRLRLRRGFAHGRRRCYLRIAGSPPGGVIVGHGLRQHFDVQQRRAWMGAGRLQRRQQALLIMYPPRATAVAFRVLREIDLHQRPVKLPGLRVTVAIFRAKASHSMSHLQVINAAKLALSNSRTVILMPSCTAVCSSECSIM